MRQLEHPLPGFDGRMVVIFLATPDGQAESVTTAQQDVSGLLSPAAFFVFFFHQRHQQVLPFRTRAQIRYKEVQGCRGALVPPVA